MHMFEAPASVNAQHAQQNRPAAGKLPAQHHSMTQAPTRACSADSARSRGTTTSITARPSASLPPLFAISSMSV